MEIGEQLLKLMNEYPELPIIPLIGSSYIDFCDDSASKGIGKLGSVILSEYCLYPMYGKMCYVLKFNQMILEEYLVEHNDCTNLSDMHQYVEAEMGKIEWKKAIFVFVQAI